MRELLLDYIDALLLGGIPKAELAAPKDEADIEKSAAAELAEVVKRFESLRTNEYQLLLNGVSILYGENRKTATERCYALFWEVQKMQSVTGQLEKCYAILQMLDCVTNKSEPSLGLPSPLGIQRRPTMPDGYISRTESLKDFEACNANNPNWTPQRVKTLLMRQPTADVAPVVRCKDCRHRGCALSKGYFDCNAYNLPRCRPDDFCSYGERVVKGES